MSEIVEIRVYPGYRFGEVEHRFDGLVRLLQTGIDSVTSGNQIYISRENAAKLVKELQEALEKGK